MACFGWESVTRADLAASLSMTLTCSRTPAAGAASIGAEFGLTAMMGVPVVTVAVTL